MIYTYYSSLANFLFSQQCQVNGRLQCATDRIEEEGSLSPQGVTSYLTTFALPVMAGLVGIALYYTSKTRRPTPSPATENASSKTIANTDNIHLPIDIWKSVFQYAVKDVKMLRTLLLTCRSFHQIIMSDNNLLKIFFNEFYKANKPSMVCTPAFYQQNPYLRLKEVFAIPQANASQHIQTLSPSLLERVKLLYSTMGRVDYFFIVDNFGVVIRRDRSITIFDRQTGKREVRWQMSANTDIEMANVTESGLLVVAQKNIISICNVHAKSLSTGFTPPPGLTWVSFRMDGDKMVALANGNRHRFIVFDLATLKEDTVSTTILDPVTFNLGNQITDYVLFQGKLLFSVKEQLYEMDLSHPLAPRRIFSSYFNEPAKELFFTKAHNALFISYGTWQYEAIYLMDLDASTLQTMSRKNNWSRLQVKTLSNGHFLFNIASGITNGLSTFQLIKKDGTLVRSFAKKCVSEFDVQSNILAMSFDYKSEYELWDLNTGKHIKTITTGHREEITTLNFVGNRIYTGSALGDTTVRVTELS